MSHIIQTESHPEERVTAARIKRCKSCWRDDYHKDIKFPPLVFGFLLVATLGLILFIRPSRCVCCGNARIF